MDLNGLKANNDYLGHERGDVLLKNLAKKLKEVMKHYDDYYMARIGGDEFLIILENTSYDVLKNVKKMILKSCDSDNITDKISVSIGVSFSKEQIDIFKLVRQADDDMYDMKKQISKEYKDEIIKYAEMDNKYIR